MEHVIELLGLTKCRHTVVGDELVRGCSGGEKRRVTLAEMLVTPCSIKFLDSITDGLDSSTAVYILKAMKIMCTVLGTTVVAALNQVLDWMKLMLNAYVVL